VPNAKNRDRRTESRRLAILEHHLLLVLLISQAETSENLQRTGSNTSLSYQLLFDCIGVSELTLLVLESLKRTTPFFSRNNLACWVKNKLAPSTTYLKFGLPSASIRFDTFEMLTASGRPPQGTKRSALTRKWKLFRKSVPSGMISPAESQLLRRSKGR
jgi:hypothetical protein